MSDLKKNNKQNKTTLPHQKKKHNKQFMVLAISIAQFSCFFFRSFFHQFAPRLSLGLLGCFVSSELRPKGGAWTWTIPPAALAGHGKTPKGSEKLRSHRLGGVMKWGEKPPNVGGNMWGVVDMFFFPQGLGVYTSCWGVDINISVSPTRTCGGKTFDYSI